MYKIKRKIIIFWQQVDESGNFKENIVQELTSIYLDENEINKLVAECSVICK